MRFILLAVVCFGLSGCQSLGTAVAGGLQGMSDGMNKQQNNNKTYNCYTYDHGTNYTCN